MRLLLRKGLRVMHRWNVTQNKPNLQHKLHRSVFRHPKIQLYRIQKQQEVFIQTTARLSNSISTTMLSLLINRTCSKIRCGHPSTAKLLFKTRQTSEARSWWMLAVEVVIYVPPFMKWLKTKTDQLMLRVLNTSRNLHSSVWPISQKVTGSN